MRSPIDDAAEDHPSTPRQRRPNEIDEAEISGILSMHFSSASQSPAPEHQSKQLSFPDSDATPAPDIRLDPGAKEGLELMATNETDSGDEKQTVTKHTADDEEEDSPYEVVRHSVSNKDDPSMYSLTFRVWLLGTVFTGVLSFVNQFFFYRQNQLSLGGSVVQLLAFPAGYVLSRVLPRRKFTTFGWSWTLNPGPFNIKEHVLISIFATASSGSPYAIDVVTIKKIWYKSDLGFVASLLFILTSQIMGYSFAGLARKFLVYPAAMIWPASLISVTLFRTFHEVQNFGGRLSRTKMFWICFIGSFVWYFVPNFLIPALSYIALLCYVAPNNVIANQLGDSYNGLGMLNFTLDWSTISSNMGSPIAYPWIMA
ncbi:hypothetical protein IWW51_005218, partial [Coemansia sp. RSA 2702]